MTVKKHRILVVDDEPAIRSLLVEFLSSLDYQVDCASDGIEALAKLAESEFHLILSDINMPHMKGFELLKTVRQKYPKIKRALITAYNVEDYFDLAMQHDVGNIIPKTAPFNFDDVEMVTHGLLTEDVFGLQKHMSPDARIVTRKIHTADQIDDIASEAIQVADMPEKAGKLKLVLVELLTNAVFYGARNENSERKEEWNRDFTLSEKEAPVISWAKDGEKFGLSVEDPYGRLSKSEVLHWLSRQTKKDESGLPVGIFDTHGRGLFIARSYVDSLIVNIKAGFRTELICINYTGKIYQGFKPLYINEL